MSDMIKGFPAQLRLGLEPLNGLKITKVGRKFTSIAVAGMGGSAFGAEVVRNLISGHCGLPFLIFRDYELPAFIGPDTLLIVSSYSGDTEETLAAFESALSRNPAVVCISSGGKLKQKAEAAGIDFLSVPGGQPPRTAAGYSICRQLQLLSALGLINDYKAELLEAIELLQQFNDHDLAREIADDFHGHLPVIYSSGALDSAALRWRQQIEENAKQLAGHHSIPEMNHNEMVGWNLPADLLSRTSVLILRSSYDHERVKLRMELSREIISPKAATLKIVDAKGSSPMSQLMYLLYLGDWVSLYLAELNGVDPVPVQVINHLKGELEKR